MEDRNLKDILHSTGLWTLAFTVALFAFLTFGLRPALHCVGLLFGLLGGQGLEGTNL